MPSRQWGVERELGRPAACSVRGGVEISLLEMLLRMFMDDGLTQLARMEVLTTRLRLRPELAGRRSPVGDGGDVEEEGGRREGGGIKIKI